MKKILIKEQRRVLRKKKIRAKIFRGGINRPRLSVSKTNKHLFLQVIDDIKGVTLVSIHDKEVSPKGAPSGSKNKKTMDVARELGKKIAEKAIAAKVKKVVFDRGKFTYHGIIKAVAEGAREGGLDF
ncbi:MAG: 50S ribosomal protein L18 [Patescibacteria group bacterium]|nr:50S ribosomal protein L18 [Patescibacteria group bacterium]